MSPKECASSLATDFGEFAAKIFQAIQGHWLSASLGVIMQLRIPELLAEAGSPMEFKEVSCCQWLLPLYFDAFTCKFSDSVKAF